MRNLIFLCVATVLLVVSTSASARGYGHGYRHHNYGHHGYRHHSYGHYGGHHAGYLLGGLVLGAILAPPRYAPPPPRVVYAPVAAPPPTPTHATVSRRLLRDINGNCFERREDATGTEMRVQLPASECAW